MASIFKHSVQGDGINFAFFQLLWQKNRNEGRGNGIKEIKERPEISPRNSKRIPLRLPDTVVFHLGQPMQWYFTSERGKLTTILRKRRKNVTIEKIEEVFLKKFRASNKGFLHHKDDVVAYFVASNECTLRNRRYTEDESLCRLDDESKILQGKSQHEGYNEEDGVCDIEFFNEKGLREYLPLVFIRN